MPYLPIGVGRLVVSERPALAHGGIEDGDEIGARLAAEGGLSLIKPFDDPFVLAGHTYRSRLLIGTGKFKDHAETKQALAVSGLLAPRLGGPSVYPYQPDKLYVGLVVGANYPGTQWPQGTGEDLYRRSLYTFWKRTVPHPAMITFDAPDREVCTVRRPRTNTPLQALLLLNDENYLEAARGLAQLILKEKDHRIEWAFHRVTGRHANARELAALRTFFNDQRTASNETQAWTMLASLLMNLDEVQTLH